MEALLAFAASLLSVRLAGRLAARWRERCRPELVAWTASLLCYAVASAALAWGSAHGWDEATFRVYYLAGGLLTAPLLGAGSLLLTGRRWARPAALVYAGLAVGIAIAVPLTAPVSGTAIPAAQDHLALWPGRIVAIAGNSLGTLAVAWVAVATFRRRPLGNALILAGLAVAATGSALAGLGTAATAGFVAAAVCLFYLGFSAGPSAGRWPLRGRAPRSADAARSPRRWPPRARPQPRR
jgi:hypothetical protein